MPVNKKKQAARKSADTKPAKAAEKKQAAKVVEETPEESEASDSSEDSESEDSEAEGSEAEGSEAEGSEAEESEAEENSEESEAEEEEEEDKESESESSESGQKRKAEDELDEQKPKKTLKLEPPNPSGTQNLTIFVGSLDFNVTEEEIRELFSQAGEITSCRMSRFEDSGKNRGTCFIDFADPAAHEAALEFNGTELRDRAIRVDHAERSKPEALSDPTKTLFVANLPYEATEEEIEGTFSQYGQVINVTLLTHPGPEQKSKGLAYVEFTEQEDATKALEELKGSVVNRRPLRLDYAQPRGAPRVQKREPRGGFRGDSRGRGGGGFRGRGGGNFRGRGGGGFRGDSNSRGRGGGGFRGGRGGSNFRGGNKSW